MKKFLLIMVFIFSGIIYSQNIWQIANQSADPPNNKLISNLLFAKNGDLIVSTLDSGVYRSTNLGESWIKSNTGITNTYNSLLTISPDGIIYRWVVPKTLSGGLYCSTDNGMSWIQKTSQPNTSLYSSGYFLFADDSNYVFLSTVLYANAYSYYNSYSSDGGTTWKLPDFSLFITCMVKLKDGTIFGHYDTPNGSYSCVSTNHGKNWNVPTKNMTSYTVRSVIQTPKGRLIAGSEGDGIYYTENYLTGWTKSSINGTLKVPALCLDSLGNIYAGTRGSGVYRSKDNGTTWTQINSGLSDLNVNSLACSKDGYLFAGTYSGVYRTVLPLTDVKTTEQPRKIFLLEQNYPNPFNPNTTINYSIPERANVKLTVYNSLGQIISELVNEEKPAGNFSVQFNAANLPSGVYFYALKSGGFVESKKLILLK